MSMKMEMNWLIQKNGRAQCRVRMKHTKKTLTAKSRWKQPTIRPTRLQKMIRLSKVNREEEDGKELANREEVTGAIDDRYETEPKDSDGNELIETPDNVTAEVTEDDQTVTYVYKPVEETPEEGTVDVEYVDEDGNELADPEELTGAIDDPYETEPKDIDGYELIETPDNATGEFTEDDQTVTYVYKPVEETPEEGTVDVEYVDEDGNPVAKPETETGDVGDPYETEPKDIDGYELIETPDNAIGEFTEDDQTVTYVYKPVEETPEEGTVDIEYIEEDRHAETKRNTETGDVGDRYEREPKE